MTIHYSVESLTDLFLSEQFILDKNNYEQQNSDILNQAKHFLNSIEINKNYYRTGLIVKNPRYKKKISDDTVLLKSFKASLNKMSSMNYLKLCPTLTSQLTGKEHLYPLIIQLIVEQALLHHNYCKYYCILVEQLHQQFNNLSIIHNQIDKTYSELQINKSSNGDSAYSQLCSKNKLIDQLIGYSIFISELEIKGIIQNKIEPTIQTILDQLSDELNEGEMYKCVLCLQNIFKVVYKGSPIKEDYITKLTVIKDKIKFMKIKFKIMDILEGR